MVLIHDWILGLVPPGEYLDVLVKLLRVSPGFPFWLLPFLISLSLNHFSKGKVWRGLGWMAPAMLIVLIWIALEIIEWPDSYNGLLPVYNSDFRNCQINLALFFVLAAAFALLVQAKSKLVISSEWSQVLRISAVTSVIMLAASAIGYAHASALYKEQLTWQLEKEAELYDAGFVDYPGSQLYFGIKRENGLYSTVSACFYTKDSREDVFEFYSSLAGKLDYQCLTVQDSHFGILRFLIYWEENHLIALYGRNSTYPYYSWGSYGRWEGMVQTGSGSFSFAGRGDCNWSVCTLTAATSFTEQDIERLLENDSLIEVDFTPQKTN